MLNIVLLVGILKLVCIHAESICLDDCVVHRQRVYNYIQNGVCDDGGLCDYGTDCIDCGVRALCYDECIDWGVVPETDLTKNGFCDDSTTCQYAYDCHDCGPRPVCNFDCYRSYSEVTNYTDDSICDDQEHCEYGHDCTDCGPRVTGCQPGYKLDDYGICVVDHEVLCGISSMTVIFNSMLLTPPFDPVYLGGDPDCPADAIITDPDTGITYYEFYSSDLTSCGITTTAVAGYIIYSTDVIADGVAVLSVQCKKETTHTVTVQIMVNPCITSVMIEGDITVDLAVFWYGDDSYTFLQPDDQYVNVCEDTKIFIGITLIGTPVLDAVLFIKNCTITGTAAGTTEVQTFTIVEEYGCPVDVYGFMIDDNSTNTNVLFCFNPYGIVNDNGVTVFDLTCDVALCLPGEPGCTQDCDGIPGRFKKSTHLTNTNPIIGGPFILNECT